jgi:hypothetical protein
MDAAVKACKVKEIGFFYDQNSKKVDRKRYSCLQHHPF